MRALRTTLASTWILGMAPALALAWAPPPTMPTVEKLLTYRPTQPGVEYEVPTDPAAIAACKVEQVTNAKGASIGYALRDGQGKLLCRFVDSDGNNRMDQWGYFQDGFEIYRDIDLNNDMSIDEVRWMNSAGTRMAKVANRKVVAWTRISAEEASKVFLQALVAGDAALIDSVMATPAELDALGIPKGEVDQVAAAEKQRLAAIKALRAGVMAGGWDASTTWATLGAAMPHLIPADAGLKDDLLLYENAMIFPASPNNAAAGKMAFLQAGEMVKVGDAWKFVDLPRVIDPNKNAPIAASEGGIRSWVFRNDGANAGGGENPQVAEALQALAAYDKANQGLLNADNPKDIARFHVYRVAPLNKVVKAAEAAGDAKAELDHLKLSVDSLAAAYTSGAYPAGAKALDDLAAKGGKVGTYAAFKMIEAEYALQNDKGGNFPKVQKDFLNNLKAFVDKHPQCDEAPQALLFLASTNEMNAEEDEARKFYATLARDYPATEWGKKAAGALKRFDLVGKPIALKGPELRGQTVDVAQYRGKTVLVAFWATWANPAKRDLPDLVKVHQKYAARGFEVVAVNLDNEKADLDAFLKATPLPWPEIFEPGGMEGRLATEFGVISLPTMILVDPDGKVVNRSLRTASEVEIVLDKTFATKGGVALGTK